MFACNGKVDIKSLLPGELEGLMKEMGQPAYRAGQIFHWLSSGCGSWDEMTNLPGTLRRPWRSAATWPGPAFGKNSCPR